MYSVTVTTSNSDVVFGTTISSTKKLHEFVSAMDFQLVTDLRITYYREMKSPHDLTNVSTDTGSMAMVSHGPDSWEITTPIAQPHSPIKGTRILSAVTESTLK